MYVSHTIVEYLDRCEADFEVLSHPHTSTSEATAHKAGLPAGVLAKAVMLSAEDEFLLAVVPASRHVDPDAVAQVLHAHSPELAREADLPWVFRDCERGAVPALGVAYGLPTVVDDELLRSPHVYFEGGDHEHLVHMRGADFARIMIGQPHGRISC